MKRLGWTTAWMLTAGLLAGLLVGVSANGQQTLQQGFEGRDPLWTPGAADAVYKESAHRITDEFAKGGRRSETIELDAEAGSYIHYTYDVGKAIISDELNVSLWVKANRPGIQLLCRVVLPREHDPKNLDKPMTTLIRADDYQITGRWQQLTLRQPQKRLREQLQLLRAELKRDVIGADAYIDRLVLNVWSGKGATQVWIDDLEISPVEELKKPADPIAGNAVPGKPVANRRPDAVQLEGVKLLVGGKPFFPRIIRNTGTPPKTLYDAGFNVIALDETTPPGVLEEAASLGFLIMPAVTPPAQDQLSGRTEAVLTANQMFGRKVSRFLDQGSLLSWDLGGDRTIDQFAAVSREAQAIHAVDPMRPISVDVSDGLQKYSRGMEQLMLGAHRWPLLTGMELTAYRDWLTQRRQLAQPGAFCWTWVQTHVPDWFLTTAYEREGGGFTEPLGPQAEQIRLMAYAAVGSGYRGLGFWSDRFLADSHTGRDRLLALALLNQELEMLEPILVEGREPTWIDTSRPEVKAAVIRTKQAILVLPMWIGGGAQYVPGQDAVAELGFTAPMVPQSWQAWQVSPAEVRSLQPKRVLGGARVSLHDFSLTAAVVFTPDLGGMVVRLQNQQRRMAPTASQWAHDQAAEELAKAEKVDAQLTQAGHKLPDAAELLKKAHAALEKSVELRRNGSHEESYEQAQAALRSLRILMRAHWDAAVKQLSVPTASPFAVSFYTLPKHWQFMDEIKDQSLGANVLPGGDFETDQGQQMKGWLMQEPPSLDDVTAVARRVKDEPKEGRQCLMLQLSPKDKTLPPLALERTFVAILSPAVHLPPGTPVAISAWVRIPQGISASADGALLYDSIGGEPLAVRLTGATKWKKFILYRRVPASGVVNVTMALTGLGTVYFDDVRIEPLTGGDATATVAHQPETSR
jgi:hypothetical protein